MPARLSQRPFRLNHWSLCSVPLARFPPAHSPRAKSFRQVRTSFSPFNFSPISTVLSVGRLTLKVGHALATGDSILLKPFELTAPSALFFITLIEEAGFPPGIISIVNGYAATAYQATQTISEHPSFAKPPSLAARSPVARLWKSPLR
ncbi:hypothetical protein OG21DRAFT_1270012 [Imleria badia]|nr:hypothetical protein OG21DRAFT_1270012 [Imleria badia]